MYRERIRLNDGSLSGPVQFIKFDGLNEMIDLSIKARAKYAQNQNVDILCDNGPFSYRDFIGRRFESWDEITEAGKAIWEEGLSIFESMRRDLEKVELPQPISRRRRPVYSEDDGDEIDMYRLEHGQPFWRTTRRELRVAQQTVTVVSAVSTPCSKDWSDVLWRGVAGLVLADRLENAGYRVEIWGAQHVRQAFATCGDGFASACCLKQADDPLDAATLVSALSGWFYRTCWFASYALSEYTPSSNFGRPTGIRSIVSSITDDDKVAVIEKVFSRASAIDLLREELAKFVGQPA